MEDTESGRDLKSLASGTSRPAMDPFLSPGVAVPRRGAGVVHGLGLAGGTGARCRVATRNLPRNAGKAWSPEEDEKLLAAFDGGARSRRSP